MINRLCCEEMEILVQSLKEAVASSEVECGVVVSYEDEMPDELTIKTSDEKVMFIPNIIFRFCPYCGKMLNSERKLTTSNEFLLGVGKALRGINFKETSLTRRLANFEEVLDVIRQLAERAISDEVASKGVKK